MKTTSKIKMTSKICPPLQILFCPPSLPLRITENVFWWPLKVTATPQLMLNRKGYQASKPKMECHMINMMYAALPMKRRHLHAKTTVYWWSPHTVGHIPHCVSNTTFAVLVITTFWEIRLTFKLRQINCNLLTATIICKLQSADLFLGSHSISYWVPDLVPDSIPD